MSEPDTNHKGPSAWTRRAVIKALPAASLSFAASCKKPAEANLFNVLARYQFDGQDGRPLNISALAAQLKDDYVTLNFGLNNCTSNFCAKIDKSLGHIHTLTSSRLTHIIIDVDPQVDGKSPASREDYLNMVSAMTGLNAKNIIILYPKATAQYPDAARQAPDIAMALNMYVSDDPKSHSAEIALFKPGGQFLDKKNSNPLNRNDVSQFDPWRQLMAKNRQGR